MAIGRRFLFCLLVIIGQSGAFADPLAFVTNQQSNDVSVVDTATGQLIKTVAVGIKPAGVSIDNAGAQVFISNPGDGTVSVIDMKQFSVSRTLATG
ncbi:MAG: YncE family protein, partial [Gammaproteobacteria bacterium]|nr:YncE family protein [Gammaproteobacteria bacterium]